MTFIYIIGALMLGASIFTLVRCIGTPKNNNDARNRAIEEEVAALGGVLEKIEISKSSCYPYLQEINQNDGSYHVYYKVTYRINDQHLEGWAVLKLQQTLVGPVGSTENSWIWKLND